MGAPESRSSVWGFVPFHRAGAQPDGGATEASNGIPERRPPIGMPLLASVAGVKLKNDAARGPMGGLLSGMPLLASVAPPSGWVPARWNGTNPQTLDLLSGAPINCLLLSSYTPEFVTRATARGIVTLAVLKPGADPAD